MYIAQISLGDHHILHKSNILRKTKTYNNHSENEEEVFNDSRKKNILKVTN